MSPAGMFFVCAGAALCLLLIALFFDAGLWEITGFLCKVAAALTFVYGIAYYMSNNDDAVERRRTAAAQEEAQRQPYVIRRVDGCEVYTFKEQGRWHYFTRCPGSRTSTDTTHVERCGKTTCERTGTIVTETKP